MTHENGHAALGTLDAILAAEPEPDKALFSQCVRQLSAFRDSLIASGERGGAWTRECSDQPGDGWHFPLGPVPWEELRKARGWLAEVSK